MAKFYAVRKGNATGIFNTWAECEAQVKGFKGADYKSFPTLWQAQTYMEGGDLEQFQPKPYLPVRPNKKSPSPAGRPNIYTDGSFIQGKGYAWAYMIKRYEDVICEEYGVGTNTEAAAMRNIAGELSAVMRAVTDAYDRGYKEICICHDYLGVDCWARGSWKAKNKFTQYYAEFMNKKMDVMDIKFSHIKGHTGNAGNEHVDELCRRAFEEAGL